MMESYTKYYGRYAEQEWREGVPVETNCSECGKEASCYLINIEEREVIGCESCMVTTPSYDEKYMVDIDGATYLKCPCCGKICDTLYAARITPYYVDGCENCLEWVDSYELED